MNKDAGNPIKRKRPTDEDFKKAITQTIVPSKEKLRFGVDETESVLVELPIDSIVVEKQVRSHFGEAEIESLAESIKQVGLQQPIKVTLIDPVFKRYRLDIGERRLRAFKKLGKSTIPAFIGKEQKQNRYTIQLYENIHRKDLHPIEKAAGIVEYMIKELELRNIKIELDIHTVIRSVINKVAFKRPFDDNEKVFYGILGELKVPFATLRKWFVTAVFSKEAQDYFIKTATPLNVIEKLSSKAHLSLEELIEAVAHESEEVSKKKVSISFVSSGFKAVNKKLSDISRTISQTNMVKNNPKVKTELLLSIEEVIKIAEDIKKNLK